jgi:AcrR family transcriptional regulator
VNLSDYTIQLNPAKLKWLEEGYRQFADYGPDKLSINQISKEIGSSRASFYHYFGDIDVFIDELLSMHWKIIEAFHEVAKKRCTKLVPDLYNELARHPESLRFNLQLFHNRHIPDYNYIFIRTYETGAKAFALKLFKAHFKLKLDDHEAYKLWLTLGEAWYSRLDPNDLSHESIRKHGEDILKTVRQFMTSELYKRLNAN